MKHEYLNKFMVISFLLAIGVSWSQAGMAQRGGDSGGSSMNMDRMEHRDRDMEQIRDRDRERDQDGDDDDRFKKQKQYREMEQERNQDNTAIYGGKLMTDQERNRYREQLRNAGSDEEREQLMMQHREMIEQRAAEQGVELTD